MQSKGRNTILISLLILVFIYIEPALANKFETIGSGVSGSVKIKVEYLKTISYVAGGIMLIAGVLTLTMRDKNSQSSQLHYVETLIHHFLYSGPDFYRDGCLFIDKYRVTIEAVQMEKIRFRSLQKLCNSHERPDRQADVSTNPS